MGWGGVNRYILPKLHDKDGGFIVNDEIQIVAEVDVFEAINYVPKKPEKATIPNSKIEENNGVVSRVLLKEASAGKESIDVNGFQVLPSQVISLY